MLSNVYWIRLTERGKNISFEFPIWRRKEIFLKEKSFRVHSIACDNEFGKSLY